MTPKVKQDIQAKYHMLGNHIDNLNRGGCAIAAYAMQKYVNKTYPELNTYIVYFFDDDSMPDFEEWHNNNCGSCSHAYLKVEERFFDSDNNYKRDGYVLSQYTKSITFEPDDNTAVLNSIHTKYIWNSAFNRADVELISSLLGIDPLNEIQMLNYKY